MESSGDVELRIFTLMGRLVRFTELSNVPEGLHTTLLSWDGSNGQGNRVVNGVYIAVLQVRYRNGGTETYETKVAYIK
jgi:flagellar hook assembly protein FlgD